ncbi:MAG: BrnT family toxin [Xanthobacteraceae bacterium]
MEFAGFNWDDGNRKKCQKHGISIAEFESVFSRPVVILPDKDNPQGERRFRAIGSTSKGRHAFVVFTLRHHGMRALLRPISARYMHKREVKNYEKNYPDV